IAFEAHLTTDWLRRTFRSPLYSMKRYLPFVIVVVVALATVGSGALLYRAKRPHVLPIPEDKTLSAKSSPESPHVRGNPNAPVTLEEYGDFQCPPCGMFAAFAGQLEKEYDSRLRVVFRNFPLKMHEHAAEAALAAEAAGMQGRFWEMHDVLYKEQDNWSTAPNVRELFESTRQRLDSTSTNSKQTWTASTPRPESKLIACAASLLAFKPPQRCLSTTSHWSKKTKTRKVFVP